MAKRLGEKLIEAGLVSAEAVEQALSHQKITSHRLGDCLVELGLIQEGPLLRFLAAEFKTRFVSAEKLAQAKISADVLEKVPVRMAEKQDFLPIAFDAERRILSIVMAEPQNEALVKEIAIVTDMTEVFAYVGVRSAIQAAIKKHYYGDPTAFASMQSGASMQQDARKLAGAYEGGESRIERTGISSSGSGKTSSRVNPTQLREALGAVRGQVGENDFVETLNILVGLLEMPRKEFRGHSAQIARQSQLIARRIGLQPREVSHTSVAAYLHDLGKKPDKHFTLPLLAASPEARAEAKRYARAPIKLFETVHLPGGVNAVLAQLYEAYDGSGVPHGAKGEDISAGARIIAAVDAFFELTRNPFNLHGRVMTKAEAIASMREQAGTLFDPVVVDTLDVLQSGDILKQRVEQDGRQVFVADPDEAVRTDLMDSLAKDGLVVQSVIKLDGLIDAVLANEADTLVVGLGYGVGDIVALVQFVRARPESAALPVLLLGDPTDPASRERLVQAGVTGFIPLPLVPDEAAQTIRTAYLDRLEHGGLGHVVRGSFDELASLELAKVLGAARKSGRLTVRNGPQEGYLQFERGCIIFALFADKKGESAIQPLLTLPQADFSFDPEALLTDNPNVEKDFDIVARQLAG
ncbi:MAG: HD domain-containing phosphohydrolase [Archangium sp.]|nr:HD domain-containing phosphohydrolase [Archangium sp.]MDP3574060.1 HD domain-containing phosphohydrolase [Archangium sp.]